jgi:acyl transferase domain-containing protein
MHSVLAGGTMLSVTATEDDAMPILREFDDRVGIAAINSPKSLIISGEGTALAEVAANLEAHGMQTKRLPVSHAFHSSCLDPILPDFSQVCQHLSYHVPAIGVISGLTGKIIETAQLRSPEYWVDQLKKPVRFMDAVRCARFQGGVSNFLEIGPGAELSAMTKNSITDGAIGPGEVIAAPLLRRPKVDENNSFVSGLATVYARGTPIDWAAGYAGSGGRRVDLPTYAFQRKRLWLDRTVTANVWSVGRDGAQLPKSKVRDSESIEPVVTETERTLASAIEQVLGVAQVGRTDEFLALGGDSIGAMQLTARVRAAGLPLIPQMIFEHPTVMRLAAALDNATDEAETEGVNRVVGEDVSCEPMSMSGLSPTELAALEASWPTST